MTTIQFDQSNCRSCDADIIWGVTEKDKRMPVDADPVEGGSFALVNEEVNGKTIVRAVWRTRAPEGTTEFHASHFATCPNAEQHRS